VLIVFSLLGSAVLPSLAVPCSFVFEVVKMVRRFLALQLMDLLHQCMVSDDATRLKLMQTNPKLQALMAKVGSLIGE
jgi:hypothetical protein